VRVGFEYNVLSAVYEWHLKVCEVEVVFSVAKTGCERCCGSERSRLLQKQGKSENNGTQFQTQFQHIASPQCQHLIIMLDAGDYSYGDTGDLQSPSARETLRCRSLCTCYICFFV